MIIREIKTLLETATNPVARVLYKHGNFRVLAIGFKQGMILKDHKTPYDSKLLVMEGAISYNENDTKLVMQNYDEHQIPMNVVHNVLALEDSLCLLIQS